MTAKRAPLPDLKAMFSHEGKYLGTAFEVNKMPAHDNCVAVRYVPIERIEELRAWVEKRVDYWDGCAKEALVQEGPDGRRFVYRRVENDVFLAELDRLLRPVSETQDGLLLTGETREKGKEGE